MDYFFFTSYEKEEIENICDSKLPNFQVNLTNSNFNKLGNSCFLHDLLNLLKFEIVEFTWKNVEIMLENAFRCGKMSLNVEKDQKNIILTLQWTW